MSYAVIQTGGKQYKVKSGEILKIEKLADSKPDTKVEFKEILAYGDDKTIEIFKKRRRQNSRRKNGHRQEYSLIRISKIFAKDGKLLSEAEKISKPAKAEETKEVAGK